MSNADYLDRYHNGEYTEVWADLVAFGPAIRADPLYTDAAAVARETMLRAKHNVERLVARL